MRRTSIFLAAAAFLAVAVSCGRSVRTAIPRDADIERKLERVLSGMTLEDKVGQMVQLNISTVLDESQDQIDLVKALHKTGRPIVLILNEGRPRVVSGIEPLAPGGGGFPPRRRV